VSNCLIFKKFNDKLINSQKLIENKINKIQDKIQKETKFSNILKEKLNKIFRQSNEKILRDNIINHSICLNKINDDLFINLEDQSVFSIKNNISFLDNCLDNSKIIEDEYINIKNNYNINNNNNNNDGDYYSNTKSTKMNSLSCRNSKMKLPELVIENSNVYNINNNDNNSDNNSSPEKRSCKNIYNSNFKKEFDAACFDNNSRRKRSMFDTELKKMNVNILFFIFIY
jgi:hypothetical protein